MTTPRQKLILLFCFASKSWSSPATLMCMLSFVASGAFSASSASPGSDSSSLASCRATPVVERRPSGSGTSAAFVLCSCS
eukprot:CAMPEP_0202699240 /NCGR_PEP_ID=MMETSP1385-20130828/12462_1 /ASSEMBLY_ACC=CAM_ASM_000861 /TAXON_ID=933848 /ORGANISM="Elphidium margaritaceum" /LENGTH=79 /DNA_ID=CAMNT_0049356133 /DNA_START=20 /DNA_END=255 /DNA_ORIENTATION=-